MTQHSSGNYLSVDFKFLRIGSVVLELRVAKNRHFSDKNEFFDQLVVFNRGRGMGQRVPNDHLEPMVLVKFTRATPDGGRLNDLETSRKEQRHPEKLTTKKN